MQFLKDFTKINFIMDKLLFKITFYLEYNFTDSLKSFVSDDSWFLLFILNLLDNIFCRAHKIVKKCIIWYNNYQIVNAPRISVPSYLLRVFFIFLYFRTDPIRFQHPLPAFISHYKRSNVI